MLALLLISYSLLTAQERDTLGAEEILRMSFADLMNTKVVSASKVSQQIKDVSATVQVITAEQIKERGYFTLEEALGDLPGFQFRNMLGFNSYIFMRGAPSQNNLIILMVDGVQINELNSGGFYAGGQFNMSNIEMIEVVYGPASTLYGTNAVSGIINIITKKSRWGKTGEISLGGGGFNSAVAELNIRDHNEERGISYSVSGMYKMSSKADLRGAKGDYNWSEEMENFEDDISLSANFSIKNFSAGIYYQNKKSSMTTYSRSAEDKYLDRNTMWNIDFINGFARYSSNSKGKVNFSSTLYYRNSTVRPNTIYYIIKDTDTTNGYQVGYYRPNQLIGIDNQIHYSPFKRLMITGGITGEIESLSENFSQTVSSSVNEKPPYPQKPNMLNNRLLSYYLQLNLKIFEQLSFVGGFRHDFSSYYGQVFTPRAGLVLNTGEFTAKLMYNNAFRAPKPWDYTYGLGNPSLKPERIHSLELFTSYSIGKNLSIGGSVYRNIINQKLTQQVDNHGVRWINDNNLNTFGFELYLNYSANRLSLHTNYTYNNSYEFEGIAIPEISNNVLNAGIGYSFTKHIRANIRANYIGGRNNPSIIPTTGDNRIKGAIIFNGAISLVDIYGFDLQLKVNNFFNKEYYHPSHRFDGRYRQPQRNIMLVLTYNLFR